MENLIKKEERDFLNIFGIIKKRDFSSYSGMAVKNSIYHFTTTFVGKIGSLIFTIILARLLMPELFGLYSLAISTIVLFAAFTDLGVYQSLIRFVSKSLGKNKPKKAKIYTYYLLKIKIFLLLIVSVVLIISAKFIANNYYHKPLSLALIAGSLYILSIGFTNFIELIFQASNKFKYPLFKELFFQTTRLILVPVVILVLLNHSVSQEISLFWIIFAISMAYFFTLIFLFYFIKKKITFLRIKQGRISDKEKKEINKFMLPLFVTVLSGIFFGYIDMIMLGRFVLAEYIGYYRVAFSLIAAAASLISFSIVLFPIFSRLKGKRLEEGFKKSIRITLLLSTTGIIATFLLAPLIIKILFGYEYLNAIPLLRILSFILITLPITSIYSVYFYSKGKTSLVAKLLVSSTIINIVLNYVFIIWLINYSQFMATIGVAISTVISRYLYLGGLVLFKNR